MSPLRESGPMLSSASTRQQGRRSRRLSLLDSLMPSSQSSPAFQSNRFPRKRDCYQRSSRQGYSSYMTSNFSLSRRPIAVSFAQLLSLPHVPLPALSPIDQTATRTRSALPHSSRSLRHQHSVFIHARCMPFRPVDTMIAVAGFEACVQILIDGVWNEAKENQFQHPYSRRATCFIEFMQGHRYRIRKLFSRS